WSLVIGDGPDFVGMMLMVGDPPYGAMVLTMGADDDSMQRMVGPPFRELIAGGYIWIVAYLFVAVFLYMVAEAGFDRCLGRIPDDGQRPSARRSGRPSRARAEQPVTVPLSAAGGLEGRP